MKKKQKPFDGKKYFEHIIREGNKASRKQDKIETTEFMKKTKQRGKK